MSKRKREDDVDEHDAQIEDQAVRIKVSRLRVKLDQGVKKLSSALKLARGFERQKMGRRQKEATNEPHTLLRLREEVILLKQLQLGPTAKSHLFKHLSRTKRIRESPAFAHIYDKESAVESAKSGAEANVLARLFNSAPVKQAFDETMKSIFGVLGIPQVPKVDSNSRAKSKGIDGKKVENDPAQDEEFNGFSSARSSGDGQSEQEFSMSDNDADAPFKHRLAASDEESGGSEDFSEENDRKVRELSISSYGDEDNLSPGRGRTSNKAQKIIPTTKTAFLPSLSMGGYYSGSESDAEDDFDRRSPPALETRKNRRGQRARQQLAEKKFGQKAKHLQKQKQKVGDNRSSGWDAKRGAVNRQGGPGRPTKQSRPTGRDSHNRSARIDQAKPDKPQSRDDSGSLHPSWEAAKKRKMEDQGMPKFAGKKITFD